MGHFMRWDGMNTLALKPENVLSGVLANNVEIASGSYVGNVFFANIVEIVA